MIENIQAFLDAPRIAYFSTTDLQGYPHTVPVWYATDGDDIIFSSGMNRARVKYIQANPKGAVTIGGNMGDPHGYLIKGNISIEEDPGYVLMDRVTRRYIGDEKGLEQFKERVKHEHRVIFRLKPVKVIRVS
jgi:predicted pyridoxine 5'-phosphate oxidase superfamily flavin-nucleotide-binding protein